jgi:lipoprotein-releasing system ATP-binding protein
MLLTRPPVTAPIVVASNVQKSFRHMGRTLEVLRGIDIAIDDGEVLAIVGPSGAGKSTLLYCIGTLDVPTGGSIRLAGEEITRLPGWRLAGLRNRTIGFVFQFHHLLPEFNAVENVMMPGLVQGLAKRELETRARALLEEVGLRERVLHRPGELSGGEQQRVALARALLLEPKILLADEPTGNLDSKTSVEVMAILQELETQGITVALVTHAPDVAEYASRLVVVKDGNILSDERHTRKAAIVAQASQEASHP